MKVSLEVQFKTAVPIGQETGVKMWEIGTYFKSIGPSTYLLQSQGESGSIPEAVEGLVNLVCEKVGTPGGWGPIVLKVSAEATKLDT